MNRKTVSGIMLTLLLVGTLLLAFSIQPVKASGTIYIRADGSIDPPTAPISTVDKVTYIFTDNIYDSIVVERDNIVVDGAGYTVNGTESYGAGYKMGITLLGRSNVTIKNTIVKGWSFGIYLSASSGITLRNNNMSGNRYNFEVEEHYNISHFIHDIDTSNTVDGKPVYYLINQRDLVIDPFTFGDVGYLALVNSTNITVQDLNLINHNYEGVLLAYTDSSWIVGNTITNNCLGVYLLESSGNTVSGNTITNNEDLGIFLEGSHNTTISGNNITYSSMGMELYRSHNNTVSGNTITNNEDGIHTTSSSGNTTISGNNITNDMGGSGVSIWWSSGNNIISGNYITDSGEGIYAAWGDGSNTISCNTIINSEGVGIRLNVDNNTVFGNNVINGVRGIRFGRSSNNKIYHNNFIDNKIQVEYSGINTIWDDGYPSGGNYWSEYAGNDTYSGPHQNITGNDGIGDTPYVIDGNNQDSYPLMKPWTPIPSVEDTEAYIEYVNETIQDLPDEIFSKLGEDAPDVKNDFSDLFDDALENIDEGNYEGAIEKLNGIKERIYEQIVESDEREEIISMIDDLIAYLETLL